MDSKTSILKKIRSGIQKLPPYDFRNLDLESPLYVDSEKDSVSQFIEAFTVLKGQVILCTKDTLPFKVQELISQNSWTKVKIFDPDLAELCKISDYDNSQKDIAETEVCITACESLIAQTGSVMVSETSGKGRIPHIIPENHLVIASVDQLVSNLDDAVQKLSERYGNELPSSVTCISGASRTADIEKTLIMGAHGPKKFFVFLTK